MERALQVLTSVEFSQLTRECVKEKREKKEFKRYFVLFHSIKNGSVNDDRMYNDEHKFSVRHRIWHAENLDIDFHVNCNYTDAHTQFQSKSC